MTIRLKINDLVDNGPVCFKNFYRSHMTTVVNGDTTAECMNELLAGEPCKVKYTERRTWLMGFDSIMESWLEFETIDDYTTFVLRWS